jgi:hypothetical protein
VCIFYLTAPLLPSWTTEEPRQDFGHGMCGCALLALSARVLPVLKVRERERGGFFSLSPPGHGKQVPEVPKAPHGRPARGETWYDWLAGRPPVDSGGGPERTRFRETSLAIAPEIDSGVE